MSDPRAYDLPELLRAAARRTIRALAPTEYTFLLVAAIFVGILGGYGAIGFRYAIKAVEVLGYGAGPSLMESVRTMSWWHIVLLPAAGGLIVGPIAHFFARESKGHGVPEVMESIVLHGGVIRPRVLLAKLIASATCIGTGGSVGREGPIVQIGCAGGSFLGRLLKVPQDQLKTLVGCGAAAGIAATFNAPIAGALFAAEIILGAFGVRTLSPIVLSSVMATVISRHYLGDSPALDVPEFALRGPVEIAFYMGLGVFAGVVGVAFTRTLYASEDLFEKVRLPGYLLPMVGGAMVGGIAVFFPDVLGLGYETIDMATHARLGWAMLAGLLLLKITATSITLGSGGSGGIFAPSLFIGAVTGGLIGCLVNGLFPDYAGPPGAYALVGMGAVVSATTHGPITAILIIFELTDDYKIILPVMSACVIATLVAGRLLPDSIYTLKLTRRGLRIVRGREVSILRSVRVNSVVAPHVDTLDAGATFDEIVALFQRSPQGSLPVVGLGCRLLGVIRTEDLKPHLLNRDLGSLVLASDIMAPPDSVVYPDEDLEQALEKLASQPDQELPVVARDNADHLLGLLSQGDLLDRYEREIHRRRMAGQL